MVFSGPFWITIAFLAFIQPTMLLRAGQSPATLNIRGDNQALVDDYVIEKSVRVQRIMHQPEKYPGNPVLKSDQNWENGAVFLNGGPAVVWEPRDHLFKMWYFTYTVSKSATRDGWVESFIPSYATSKDGIHWDKPILRQFDYRGSTANNLLSWPSQIPQGATNILYDPRDTDPTRRYKSLFYSSLANGPSSKTGLYVSFSKDGIHWVDYGGNPVRSDVGDTHTIFGWDQHFEKYVAYLRPKGRDRVIGRSESSDFISWTDPSLQIVLRPDGDDPKGSEFYGMPVARFGEIYYGLLWIYHNEPHWPWPKGTVVPEEQLRGDQQTVDAQIALSRDGISWHRPGDRHLFLPLGESGLWDDGMLYPTNPLRVGDEIWIYYGGMNVRHTLESLAQMEKKSAGRVRGGAIGLAKLRWDGFFSMRADTSAGTLTTRPLIFAGDTLRLNVASTKGSVRVEIRDPDGNAISGYRLSDCIPIRADSVRTPVRWRGGASVSKLAGRPVRIRFQIAHSDLYAFQFGPD